MRPNLSIDEMAMKQLLSHKNDKSNRWIAKMNGRFGRGATNEAIRRNTEILRMCGITDVNSPLPATIKVFPSLVKKIREGSNAEFRLLGDSTDITVIDEFCVKYEPL